MHLEAFAGNTQHAVKGALNGGEKTQSIQQKQRRRGFFFKKTDSRKTHKQAATEDSGSKSQAKRHEGGNPAFGDVQGFQASVPCFICPKYQDALSSLSPSLQVNNI